MPRSTDLAALAVVLALAACQRPMVRPAPPSVTPCLEQPEAAIPDALARPPVGEPIPDTYVVALEGMVNALLGVITTDRIQWRGERRCIGRLREDGQVQ